MVGKGSDQALRLVLRRLVGLPSGRVPPIPEWARRNDGQDEAVHPIRVQTGQAVAAVGEHAATLLSENHLGSTLAELLPDAVVLQRDRNALKGEHSGEIIYWVLTAERGRRQRGNPRWRIGNGKQTCSWAF